MVGMRNRWSGDGDGGDDCMYLLLSIVKNMSIQLLWILSLRIILRTSSLGRACFTLALFRLYPVAFAAAIIIFGGFNSYTNSDR